MKTLERFLHYIDTINEKTGSVVAYLLYALVFVTLFEVVARYVFNVPTIWAWDVNLQIFGIVILLGGGYDLLHGAHISIDAIPEKLSPRGRLVLGLIGMLVLMFVAVVLVVWGGIVGWQAFVAKQRLNTLWAPYVFHIRMLYPVCGLLLFFQGLAKFIRDLRSLLALAERKE